MKKNQLFLLGCLTLIILGGAFYYLKDFRLKQDPRIHAVLGSKNIYGFSVKENIPTEGYLIVNFWASWCPPCIQEIPSMSQFVQKNSAYKVIALSQDDNLSDIQSILKTFPDLKNSRFEIVYDQTKSFSRLFKVEKLPETFIYEFQTGKTMQISGSIDWLSAETQIQLEKFFKEKK